LTADDGVHSAVVGGDTVVVRRASLADHAPSVSVVGGPTIPGAVATPLVTPNVTIRHVGARRLATALLLPTDAGEGPFPVLVDPYGGPHAQRVVQARSAYLTSQWFADRGFAVVVIDGRGTPGRGSEWERGIHGDLAGPVLEDQVDGLLALAAEDPRLDLSRVAIRGWSFGGYLAALAVLRRPDVFHAAIAGAPVTDWRLYDTFYTERYLGDPEADAAVYDASSLLPDAPKLDRPLFLIHGLADDNVVSAHTLQLSEALLAAGRPHQVLPLTGVTHMANQEEVAENLLLFQLAFLRDALNLH
jgi:dipeptidyl-peptidase-4